ncbi:hypothetical protein [Geothrix sp. 21YS21S-2]|uniref:hypothetical protein n=1 Tax=Geothrix sp. 21YS21S-2 TaxID=3068893 RepID=UPI0027BAB26C|nr:hypothetical protein [Geothrix sp. 21YS21S-2]
MFPFRPALAALLLLGGPPGAADITLTNRTRATVRVELTEVSTGDGELSVLVDPPFVSGAPRAAWSEDPAPESGSILHGIYGHDATFSANRLALVPGATLVIRSRPVAAGAGPFQLLSFKVSRLGRKGAGTPKEVHYLRLPSEDPENREQLILPPDLKAPLASSSGPLSISPRPAGSGDHDLKELPGSSCVIL